MTAGERALYERDGFLILRDVLPRVVVDGLRQVMEEIVDRLAMRWCADGWIADRCDDLPLEVRYAALVRQLPAPLPVNWKQLLVSRPVYELWQRTELLGRVRSLVGDEVYAHRAWSGRPLEPRNPIQAVSWHRDTDLHGWNDPVGPVVSVWLPLVPVDERSGCLQFVPGSQRHELAALTGSSVPMTNGCRPCSAVLEPGDVVLFCDRVVHRSLDNIADHVRWSMEIRFCQTSEQIDVRQPPGYRCFSASDPACIEGYEVWAARCGDVVDLTEGCDEHSVVEQRAG